MKHARIIISLLVLLGATSLAEAQIVVSQTTASTTTFYEKSGRQKGVVIRPEGAVGFIDCHGSNCLLFTINCSINYQFNPFLSIGTGTGMNGIYADHYRTYNETALLFAFPLYANARVYFLDRKWSPFLDVKVGYNSKLNQATLHYSRNLEVSLKGPLVSGTVGVQYKHWDFGISMGGFTLYHNEYEYINNEYHNTDNWTNNDIWFTANVAYNLQFQKKQ